MSLLNIDESGRQDLRHKLRELAVGFSSLAAIAAEAGQPRTSRVLRDAREALLEEARLRHGIEL